MDQRPIRIIIAGSRRFESYNILNTYMNKLFKELTESFAEVPNIDFTNKINIEIISGDAIGPDRLGIKWAIAHNIRYRRFYPQWSVHGKSAGYIRNAEMALYAAGDEKEKIQPLGVLVAFWDGESKGTKNMINEAKKRGLVVFVRPVRISKKKESVFIKEEVKS